MSPWIPAVILDQQKLLNAINAEITLCRNAIPADQAEDDRRTLQLTTLTTHLLWARRVDNDQHQLELIVRPLERSTARRLFRSNRNWRQSARGTANSG